MKFPSKDEIFETGNTVIDDPVLYAAFSDWRRSKQGNWARDKLIKDLEGDALLAYQYIYWYWYSQVYLLGIELGKETASTIFAL